MSGSLSRSRWLVIAAMLGTLNVSLAEQFTPPDMAGFSLHDERDADGDGDGVNETHVLHYLNANGDSAFSMTSNGRLWAWSLDTRDNESGTHNYVIRDSDCDGIFDEVYSLDDEFHVPECVKVPRTPATEPGVSDDAS